MYNTITGTTPLAALTVSQFVEILNKGKTPEPSPASLPTDYTDGFIYGIAGIRRLFNVSHATACAWKNGFLKPAVRQHGRKIIVDKAMALELFNDNK